MGIKVEVPEGAVFMLCRDPGCGEKITFVKMPSGKSMPVNPDGTPHWATCAGAQRFKRRKEK